MAVAGLLVLLSLGLLTTAAWRSGTVTSWISVLLAITIITATLATLILIRRDEEQVKVHRLRYYRDPSPASFVSAPSTSETGSEPVPQIRVGTSPPPWHDERGEEQIKFADNVILVYKKIFSVVAPDDSPKTKSDWLHATQGIRETLAQETIISYIGDRDALLQPLRLMWRAYFQAEELLDIWKKGGFSSVGVPSQQARAFRWISLGGLGLAGLWWIGYLVPSNPDPFLWGALPFVAAGGVLWRTFGEWQARIWAAEDLQNLYDKEQERQTRGYEAVARVLAERPSDAEMAFWLSEDTRYALAHTAWVYRLGLADVYADVVLTEGAEGSDMARYYGYPARYRHYLVQVFLLTEQGARHVEIELDFASGLLGHQRRSNFRYDSISAVFAQELVMPNPARMKDNVPEKDLSHVLLVGKTLQVMLNSGRQIDVYAAANLLADPNAERLKRDRQELVRLQEEASGIDTAVRILEGVAADGSHWFLRANREALNAYQHVFHPDTLQLEGEPPVDDLLDLRALEPAEIELDDDIVLEPDEFDRDMTSTSEGMNMDNTIRNENSNITGIQANQIHGNATVHDAGSPSVDNSPDNGKLITELKQLRETVEQALTKGQLDASLGPVAISSLDAADGAAKADGGTDKSLLRRALNTLKVSADNVGGLVQTVDRIIRLFT
jgi:hypothetical protein